MKNRILILTLLLVPFVVAIAYMIIARWYSLKFAEEILIYSIPVWLPCLSIFIIKLGAMLPSVWADGAQYPRISDNQ